MIKVFSARIKSTVQSCRDSLKAELIRTLRVHSLFIAIVLFYAGALLIAARIYNALDKTSLSLYSKTLVHMTWACFLFYFAVYGILVMLFVRPDRPVRYILDKLRINYLTQKRLVNALPVFLFLPVFLSTFTSFKNIIPIINPFSWDFTFAQWDAIVHGGVQPWKLLHPIIGHPLLTAAINISYNMWFFVMFLILFWQTFSIHDSRLRMQFFLTYILSWILIGTFAAIVFSSAGPCYYSRVVEGEDIYHPLMEYLSTANERFPIWALDTQEMLWKAYRSSEINKFNGISAMPSMHMSMAFIFVLVGFRRHRWLGVSLTVFAILIMIGCVHLGWHYAIDGYVAIVCTWPIWWFVGRLLGRYGGFINV